MWARSAHSSGTGKTSPSDTLHLPDILSPPQYPQWRLGRNTRRHVPLRRRKPAGIFAAMLRHVAMLRAGPGCAWRLSPRPLRGLRRLGAEGRGREREPAAGRGAWRATGWPSRPRSTGPRCARTCAARSPRSPRPTALDVEGGPSDFALDRMIGPDALRLVRAGTGEALTAAPTAGAGGGADEGAGQQARLPARRRSPEPLPAHLRQGQGPAGGWWACRPWTCGSPSATTAS